MNRVLAARPLFRSIVASKGISAAPLQRTYIGEPLSRQASLSDLPQPEGDWRENYNNKQAKYNLILGAAAVFCVGTIAFVSQTDIIFFNAFPPDTYE